MSNVTTSGTERLAGPGLPADKGSASPDPRKGWKRVVWGVGLGLGLFITAVTLILGLFGALADPTSNAIAFYSAYLVPIIGPHMVLTSLVVVLLAVLGIRRGPRRASVVVAAVATLSLIVSTVMTAAVMHAVDQAGGSANPLTGLRLGSLASAPPDEREVYTTAGGQDLHALVYRPAAAGTSAPVMLYLHGGGWISGTPEQTAADFRWFADRGWLVVGIEYRLADATRATWNQAGEDVACGLSWVGQNAGRYGGDPQRILVAGDSAGGNLAVNVGYGAALGQATSGCGGTVPVPAAVAAMYPVVDPQDAYDNGFPLPGLEPKTFVSQYIGGSPAQFPERMRAVSSATYLSGNAPATLVIEPAQDGLIPSSGVFRFVDRARAAGVDVTSVRIPFSNHGFDKQAAFSMGNQARLTIIQHYAGRRGLLEE